MICRISGKLVGVTDLAAEVETDGSGLTYEVLLPRYLAETMLGHTGTRVTLFTRQYLEAQGQGTSFVPRVIGFASARDRAFFELFTSVKGLGNRKALRALAEEPAHIAGAIARRDAAALQRLPEIGKRLAETIVAELSGKIDTFVDPGIAEDAHAPGAPQGTLCDAAQEAVSALEALGENRTDAERLVRRALAVESGGTEETADRILGRVFASRPGP